MSDFDFEEFLSTAGSDARRATPGVEPDLPPDDEAAQAELLGHLAGMRATIEIMEAGVRNNPSDDRLFDLLDQALAQRMVETREALIRMRDRRECRGAA